MLKELYQNSVPYDEWMIPIPIWLRRQEVVGFLAFVIMIVVASSSARRISMPFVAWVATAVGVLGLGYMVWWRWISRNGSANLQYHYTTAIAIAASVILAPSSTALSFDIVTMPCGCFGGLFIISSLLFLWD